MRDGGLGILWTIPTGPRPTRRQISGGLGFRWSRGPDYISFAVGALGQLDARSTEPGHGYPFVSSQVETTGSIPEDELKGLCTDLLAVTPQEHVVEFAWGFNSGSLREIDLPFAMPNVEKLCLLGSVISGPFLQPDQPPHTKLLPSLRHLYLHHPTLKIDDDWGPLTAYLAHQTSGGQAISLKLRKDRPPVPPEVVREIEGLVDEFDLGYFGDGRG